MTTRDQVRYKWVRPNICKIVLNAPSGVHSLSPEIVSGLHSIFDELEANEKCKGYILTANSSKRKAKGKAAIFSSGLDLKVMKGKPLDVAKYLLSINKLWIRMHELSKPIIAAVNGHAIAGNYILYTIAIRCNLNALYTIELITASECMATNSDSCTNLCDI